MSQISIINNMLQKAKKSLFNITIFSIFFNLLLFVSPLYMIQIYNRVLPTRSEETLIWLTALIIALFVSMSAIDMARHLVLIRLSKVFEDHVTQDAMRLSLTANGSTASTSGANLLRDIDQMRSLLTKGHLVSLLDILWFPIFVAAVGFLHPVLAGFALASGAWLALLAFISHITVTPAMENARTHAVNALTLSDQLFAKVDVVHALGMRPALIERWVRRRSRAVEDHTKANDRLAAISSISRSSRLMAQSATLGMGAYLAIQGSISAGAIIAASVLVGRALTPIETSISAWQDLMKSKAAYERLVLYLQGSAKPPETSITLACQGKLSVENLTCSVGKHIIVRDVNFDIEPGEMIAIVGPSGSGKTTLARHLVGAWPTTNGSVRLDDIEIANLSDDMRHRYLGYVPQEIQLLDGTIIESISRFGDPIPEDIIATAQLAGIHEMILHLPHDYGTQIGLDGSALSAGQRQRLALARALYGNPVFLVLDEPCAHLDETNERMLIQTLATLRERQVTICLVTHKANLVRLADRVLLLNTKGQARLGTPNDLFRPTLRTVPTDRRKVS